MKKRPITVVFVIPHGVQLFYPELRHRQGGSEVQLSLLVRELARRGEVTPVALLGAYGQPPSDTVDGVRLLSFAHKPGLSGRISLWRVLARARPDVIVQRGSGSMTANVALYHLARRVPFIYWVAAHLDCAPEAVPGLRNPLHTKWFEWGVRRATGIIVQHTGQRELCRAHYQREALAEIPNGWPPQPYPSLPRMHHLWIGNATHWKNPEPLLELATRLSAEIFVMVLPPEGGEPDREERLRRQAHELPNVEIRGRVPFTEMAELYATAKTHILTSLAEGFPNTLVQALWSGTPILSLYVDPGKMLERHDLGLCTYGDIQKLGDQLKIWVENPAILENYSQRSYFYAAAELSMERVAERFTSVLRKMDLA